MWEGRKSGLHSGDPALVSLACDGVRHLRSNTAYTLLRSENHQIHDSGRCLIFLYQRQLDDVFNMLVSPYWWCHSLHKWGALEDEFMTFSSWEKEGGFYAILTERTRFLRKFWEKECDLWENPDIKKNVSEESSEYKVSFWGNSDRRSCLRGIWQKIRFWGYFERKKRKKVFREFWKRFSEGNLTERWMFLRIFWERESSFWGNIDRKMYVFERILTERKMILKELSQTEGGFWWNSDRKKVSVGNDEK